MNKHASNVINRPVRMLLIRMTIPSIFGMLGLTIFNIVDTYFVGRLGTVELAAISFTFPLVMLFGCFALGLGIGIMALLSRAVGNHNVAAERRLATCGLILSLLLSFLIAVVGYLTIDPVFRMLGAGDDLMPYITAYMRVWYVGAVFMVVPMIGDHILRGLGDTRTPSIVMLVSAVSNMILDPILIFGLGPFPEMGITGAAVATIFSRMIAMVVSLYIQIIRERIISFHGLTVRAVLTEWKAILYLGLPNSVIKMILPLVIGIFTAILARYNHETVAGFGVATKIEGFLLSAVHALGITAAVFVGQNLGAGRHERVRLGVRWLSIYSAVYGVASFVLMALLGRFLGGLFSDSELVQRVVGIYLWIVPLTYGFVAMNQVGASVLNVLHKPIHSGLISLVQMFVINVPLAFLLASFWEARGVFAAIAVGNIAGGLITLHIIHRQLNAALAGPEMTGDTVS